MANFEGTPNNDTFTGDDANDTAIGWDGNDTLSGNGGNDTLGGINGDDVLDGGAGDDILYGGADNDVVRGGADKDYIVGNAGRDELYGGSGDDILALSSIDDLVAGEIYDGGDGVDTLSFDWSHTYGEVVDLTGFALTGIEIINSRGAQNNFGADVRITAAQIDALTAAIGSFYITTAGSISWAGAKMGHTTQFYLSAAGNTVDLSGATQIDSNGMYGMVIGGAGVDTITGTGFEDHLEGNGGNDVLNGGGSADWMWGGLGVDELHGGDGDDRFIINDAAELVAGETYDGGAGTDVFEYNVMQELDLTSVSLAGIEGLVQTGYQQAKVTVAQITAMSRLQGFFVMSNAGTMTLTGVDLVGGLILAAGTNTVDLSGTTGMYHQVYGNSGIDTITGSNSDNNLVGGGGNDTISGGGGIDILHGDGGNDVLQGGSENDELYGGDGIDYLAGGAGHDKLYTDSSEMVSGETYDGGDGVDTLTAGGDISGSTVTSIERIWATGLTLTVAQMNSFDWYNGSFTLANAGSVILAGKELTTLGITTSAAGNSVDISNPSNAEQIFGSDIFGMAGNDTLIGGKGQDQFRGGGGDDVMSTGDGMDFLQGDAGKDTLSGGAGDDRFYVSLTTDAVAGETYDGGDGVDKLFGGFGTNIDLSGSTVTSIEILEAGQAGTITLTIPQLDQATSLAGNFQLVGGGAISFAGVTLEGIAPSATIFLSSVGNTVDLHGRAAGLGVIAGAGNDTLIGTEIGETLSGSGGNDVLIGNEGNDTLSGGTGADMFYGGIGDDIFNVERTDDVVFEFLGEGTDTVQAQSSYYLYANIEKLTLGSTGNFFGVGNDLANTITGNSGQNLLLGGLGDDVIHGNGGVDSLFGEDGADNITGDAGIDYLVGGAGGDTLDGGTDADALYGEDGDDTLWGGTDFQTDILVGGIGNDVLHGDGGMADYDRMDGGAGNDTYYVDTGDDLTFEAADGGTDTVYANVAGANNGVYLYANVENLVLLNTTTFGVGNELANTMTGSASANWLLGGAGADVLNGKAGNDVLFGEAGADKFVFEAGTGGDVIGDFQAGTDKIDLSAFFSSFAQVQANMSENGGTTAINLGGGDFIVLNGVANATLSAGDFIFAGASPLAAEAAIPGAPPAEQSDLLVDPAHFVVNKGFYLPAELFI